MYCGGCGQALVAGQAFCPRCGRTNVAGVPAGVVPAIPSLTCVEKRVNALAVGWLVYAGFVVFFGVIGLFFAEAFLGGWAGHGMHGPFSGLANGHAHWHGFFNGLGMPLFFVRLGWLALLIRAGLAIAAGVEVVAGRAGYREGRAEADRRAGEGGRDAEQGGGYAGHEENERADRKGPALGFFF